jgi:hypothetical protein
VHIYISPDDYAAAAARGISARTLKSRIRLYGWPKERAITEPVQQRTDWSVWYAVAERNGIPQMTFRTRIYRGWSPERAATEPVWPGKQKAKRLLSSRKRKYPPHIYELLRQNGISYFTFRYRVSRGWPPDLAASTPPKKG